MELAGLRCSDDDRERVAELLRGHAAVGRLDVDELDERVAAALSAKTNGELSALLQDLPSGPPTRTPVPRPAPPIAYAETWRAPGDPASAMDDLLIHVAPELAGQGYHLDHVTPHRLVFVRTRRPWWTILIAVLLFPIGLLALLHQDERRIVIDLRSEGSGTLVSATGLETREVRRAFATLEP